MLSPETEMTFSAFESADEASTHLRESDTHSLRSVGDFQEDNEEWQIESSPDSTTLMVCAFGLLPGIMITAFLTIDFLSSDSLFEATMEKKMKAWQAVLDDTLDSENLNDFAGAAIAHAAYASLPALQRNLKLPGLNLTAEHLFFVGHCAKWCENMHNHSARYAAGRSRCIVPLSNMVEFSDAFGCAPGTPMNTPKKCVFWL